MSKLVFIRTDASKQIGSGHIMRCLSLAIVLRDSGVNVEFITRNHQGNLNEQIAKMNFKVNLLMDKSSISKKQNLSKGYGFLGVSQAVDASDTINVLLDKNPDWLIIDHYALDYRWEKKLRPYCKKIMVIDDMANRIHDCDLLLDQNYIHNNNRYNDLVSEDTIRLLGPKYALLREDFIDIENKKDSFDETKRIFLFYGGVDPDNLTTTTLKAISKFRTRKFEIDVVVGSSNSNIDIIKEEMKICPHTVKLYVQIDNIADLMIKADIAIGAGGSTTWERIAAGLPSIVVTLADNQIDFTRDLAQDGYLHWIGSANQVNEDVIHNALIGAIKDQINLHKKSINNKKLVDGMGCYRVSNLLTRAINNKKILDKRNVFLITIISDSDTWMSKWIDQLVVEWSILGHKVIWVNEPSKIPSGDFCFILSCSSHIKSDVLKKNSHNLVVHESDLPKGRGWSPLSWQVLEGKSIIPVTLFEAESKIDSGAIYLQDTIKLRGNELVKDLRDKQASITINLCNKFIDNYPYILNKSRNQTGSPSFYNRRVGADSRIDINKTIKDQFNLLRIVDNYKYPAFFDYLGQRYYINIKK